MIGLRTRSMAKLFRGIAVSADTLNDVVEEIHSSGLRASNANQWQNEMPDPESIREYQAELLTVPSKIRDSILAMPAKPAVYACGDLFGASYYALSHNKSHQKPCSIVITFEAPIEALSIDGRDFLYTAFQLWDKSGKQNRDKVRQILARLFGQRILHYFDLASGSNETLARIGLCDLACYDLEVVSAHITNSVLIRGRHSTQFCSSFELPLPIPPQSIRSVNILPTNPTEPRQSISLDDVLNY